MGSCDRKDVRKDFKLEIMLGEVELRSSIRIVRVAYLARRSWRWCGREGQKCCDAQQPDLIKESSLGLDRLSVLHMLRTSWWTEELGV